MEKITPAVREGPQLSGTLKPLDSVVMLEDFRRYPYLGLYDAQKRQSIHTGKYFRNLVKSNRNQIVFTLFRFIWNQTDVCLALN